MARQSFISNLSGYALKKLKLLVNGNTHEYDTTQPVDVTITSGKQVNIVSTDHSVDIDENSTAQSVTFDLSVDLGTPDFVVIDYNSLTFSAVQTALNNGKLPRAAITSAGITVYYDFVVSSTATTEYLFRSSPNQTGGFGEIRVFEDGTKTYTNKDITQNCVLVNTAQTFTAAEKAQGRANLGISDIEIIDYNDVTFEAVSTAIQNNRVPIVKRASGGITVYHDFVVSSTVTNEYLFRSSPAQDGGFVEIRVFNDGTKSYTNKDMIRNCVQVNAAQDFTDAQKAQARSNIGAAEAPAQTINHDNYRSTAAVSVAAVYNWVSGNILQVLRDTQEPAKPVTAAEQAQGYKDLVFTLGTQFYPATSFINVVITQHVSSDITVVPNPQVFYKGIEVYLGNTDTPAQFLIRKPNTAYSALDDRGVTVQEALSSSDLNYIPIWNCTLAGFPNLSVCDRICVRFIFDDNTTFGTEPKLSASIAATIIRDPTTFNYT